LTYILTRAAARAARACWSDAEIAGVIPAEGRTPASLVAMIGRGIPRELTEDACLWALCCASGAPIIALRMACGAAGERFRLISLVNRLVRDPAEAYCELTALARQESQITGRLLSAVQRELCADLARRLTVSTKTAAPPLAVSATGRVDRRCDAV
jgi:hypothetical protein